MQLPGYQLDFTYFLGPFPINVVALWIRGVGDHIHPLFPLINNLDGGISEVSHSVKRLTVDHVVWYESGEEQPTYNIIYVDQDATAGQQNGSSWADAFTNLSAALQLADPDDLVWVAEGVYKPDNGTDRAKTFDLRNRIQLYGGFDGTEVYLSDRGDPVLHPTILSGDIGIPGDSTDNTYHILRIQDVTDFAVVDGFTIREGNALGGNTSFPFTENGAGILIYAALPAEETSRIILKNNILNQHTALNGSAISLADGFAVPLELSISQCSIHDNYAQQRAGGLYTPFSLTQLLDITINDTEFRGNQFSHSGGGAIYDYHSLTNWRVINTIFAENGTIIGGGGGAWALFQTYGTKNIQITNSEFNSNYCVGGGAGLEYFHNGNPTHLSLQIEKTDFLNNKSFANDGAGISLVGTHEFTVDFSAVDCSFVDNISVTRGGAFFTALDGYEGDGHFRFDRCVFKDNESAASLGGAINAVVLTPNDDLLGRTLHFNFHNSLFVGNKGAIVQEPQSMTCGVLDTIVNCTFIDNGPIVFGKAYSPNFNDIFRSSIYLKNSIIWEPDLPLWQILYNGDPENNSVYDYELYHCLISTDSCDLPGGEEACLTFPNFFNIDPQFVDVANGDYRLKSCSPLLNQGVNLPDIGAYDLVGNPRIMDEIVDLGAYETGEFAVLVDTAETMLNCAFDSTAILSLSTLNATAPVNYTLNYDDLSTSNTDGQFSGLPVGDYQLVIIDGQSCTDTLDFIVSAPPPMLISASTQPYIPDEQEGSIQVDSINGGTPPYQLFFENTAWDGLPMTNLSPGSYLVSSIDEQGCQVDTLIEVLLINSTSIIAEEKPMLLLSPNPVATGSPLNIALTNGGSQSYQLEIWTATGQEVAKAVMLGNELNNNFFTPTHAGLYLIILKDEAGRPVVLDRVLVQ